MSVQAMSWVIENSRHKGGSLLVLLMIANYAKSDGSGAWPSTETLATDCRMSSRQVRRIIDHVLEGTELNVRRQPGKPHLYDIPGVRGEDATPVKMSTPAGPEMSRAPRTLPPVTPDIAVSTEPKATVKEPSTRPNGRGESDGIWEALEAAFGQAPKNGRYRTAWGIAAKEIREQGGTATEVPVKIALYRVDMPQAACTPTALAKHWGRLGSPATQPLSKFDIARAKRRMNGQGQSRAGRGNGAERVGLGDGSADVRAVDRGNREAQ